MPHPSPKAWFFHRLLKEVDGVVAHNNGMRRALLGWRLPQKNIFVIPHGTPDGCSRADRRESRRVLYLPESDHIVIAISLGFITQGKMQHEAIDAIIELVQDGLLDPRYFLYVVAGEPGQKDAANIEYCRALHRKVDEARAWNYIRIIPHFVAREQLPLWYGAADFVITGSHQTFFSVSGRSHQEMAFKMPSVSSDARLLSDLNEMRSLKYNCFSQLKAHILTMATNLNARQSFARRCGAFAKETSWPNVATKHLGMYEALKQRRLSKRKGK
jgi:glycosyltransferase involved in cell wall biosynthesis